MFTFPLRVILVFKDKYFLYFMASNITDALSVAPPQSVPVIEEKLGLLRVILTVDEFPPHSLTLD